MEDPAKRGDSMAKIDSLFLALGATSLLIGMALGIHMGGSQNFALAPVHAHINLVGFAGHAIFGMAYKLWPSMKSGFLALAHAWLYIVAAPFFMIGIAVAILKQIEVLVIVSSLCLFLSVLAFAINAWMNWAKGKA
jgi:hypothetical protein